MLAVIQHQQDYRTNANLLTEDRARVACTIQLKRTKMFCVECYWCFHSTLTDRICAIEAEVGHSKACPRSLSCKNAYLFSLSVCTRNNTTIKHAGLGGPVVDLSKEKKCVEPHASSRQRQEILSRSRSDQI